MLKYCSYNVVVEERVHLQISSRNNCAQKIRKLCFSTRGLSFVHESSIFSLLHSNTWQLLREQNVSIVILRHQEWSLKVFFMTLLMHWYGLLLRLRSTSWNACSHQSFIKAMLVDVIATIICCEHPSQNSLRAATKHESRKVILCCSDVWCG